MVFTTNGRIQQQQPWKDSYHHNALSMRKRRSSAKLVFTRISCFRFALLVASSLFGSSFLEPFPYGTVDAREIRPRMQDQTFLRSRRLDDIWDDDSVLSDGEASPESGPSPTGVGPAELLEPGPSPTEEPTVEPGLDTNEPTEPLMPDTNEPTVQPLPSVEPTIPPVLDTDIPSDSPSDVPSEAPIKAQDPTDPPVVPVAPTIAPSKESIPNPTPAPTLNPDDDWFSGRPVGDLTPALGNDASDGDVDDRDVLVNDPDTESPTDSPLAVPIEAPSMAQIPNTTPANTPDPTVPSVPDPTPPPTRDLTPNPTTSPVPDPTRDPTPRPTVPLTPEPTDDPDLNPLTLEPNVDDDFFPVPTDGRQSETDVPTIMFSDKPSQAPTEQPTTVRLPDPTLFPTSPPVDEPTVPPPTVAPPSPTVPPPSPTVPPPTDPPPTPTDPPLTPTDPPPTDPPPTPTDPPPTDPPPTPTADPPPTPKPSSEPTEQVAVESTPLPTAPLLSPSPPPTPLPTRQPTREPTTPTRPQTNVPTPIPTRRPSGPTLPSPTLDPIFPQTDAPSAEQTIILSQDPTPSGTLEPTLYPSSLPTMSPTLSDQPSYSPTAYPSHEPSTAPSSSPSLPLQMEVLEAQMAMFPFGDGEKLAARDRLHWESVTKNQIANSIRAMPMDPAVSLMDVRVSIELQVAAGSQRSSQESNRRHLQLPDEDNIPDNALTIVFDVFLDFKSESKEQDVDSWVFQSFDESLDRAEFVRNLQERSETFLSVEDVEVNVAGYVPPPTQAPGSQGGDVDVAVIVGASVGSVALTIIVVLLTLRRRNGKKQSVGASQTGPNSQQSPSTAQNVKVSTEILVEPQDDVSTLGDPMFGAGGMMLNGMDKDEFTASVGDDYDYTKQYRRDPFSVDGNTTGTRDRTTSEEFTKMSSANSAALSKFGRVGDNLFADDGSFEQQFVDPEERFDVVAPAGKLGMVIDTPNGGVPVVHAIKETSVLADQVRVGDRLMSVDGEDCTGMTAMQVSNLISLKSEKTARVLIFSRSTSSPNRPQ